MLGGVSAGEVSSLGSWVKPFVLSISDINMVFYIQSMSGMVRRFLFVETTKKCPEKGCQFSEECKENQIAE